MPPVPPPMVNGKPTINQPTKSWKKINEERKALKKQRKQEKLIKALEKSEQDEAETTKAANGVATATAIAKTNSSTVSIAVPGSILENAQSAELRSYVAGQIARAACIFRVNEVIVFDDVGIATARETKRSYEDNADEADDGAGAKTVRSSSLQLARILQYLECPQYLRKFFFPLHKDLKYSGLLNPLDAPHHLRQQNIFRYREGIISERQARDGHSYVNVGLLNDVLVNKAIEAGVRVTVKLDNINDTTKKLRGTVVSPDEPRRATGVYWGYSVRIAHSLSEIFTKSNYAGGYDLTVGTSDRGAKVSEVPSKSYAFNHLLIVFGGLKGLEEALSNDDKLSVDDPELLFDHYVNVLPKQGSRTIRTEEALLIALAALQEKFNPKVADVEEDLSEFLPRSEDTGLTQLPAPHPRKEKKKRKHVEEQQEENEQQLEAVAVASPKKQRNAFREDNNDAEAVATPKKPRNAFREDNNDVVEMKSKKLKPKTNDVVAESDDFEVVAANEGAGSKASGPEKDLGDLSRFD